jgi:hypothetical protein
MHVDLTTLYLLVIGTLLVSAGMTLWERKIRPERSLSLDLWASGYVMLALGCFAATDRGHLPGVCGAALSNLVIMSGYLLILNGVASLSGRHYRLSSIGMLAGLALMWSLGGTRWQGVIWTYISAGRSRWSARPRHGKCCAARVCGICAPAGSSSPRPAPMPCSMPRGWCCCRFSPAFTDRTSWPGPAW